jgi:iron complex outermembrane recepter protein
MGTSRDGKWRRRSIVSVLTLMCGWAVASAADLEREVRFNIPPQALLAALYQFSTQAKVQVVTRAVDVSGANTRGLSGIFSVGKGLAELLRDTGFSYEAIDATTVAITVLTPRRTTFQNGAESSSVDGGVPGAHDESGDTGTRSIDRAQAREQERRAVEEVVVTGSHLQGDGGEGSSPVIAITRADIERSGAATLREVLHALPQAAVSPNESGSKAFLGQSTIQLRGLSQGSTLVLINGRRAATSNGTFFDLASLPLETVDRIEVLTDTASAIYGADAAGGVVNFILKDSYDGVGASLRYGTTDVNDATEKEASLTMGGASERHSSLLIFSVLDRDPAYERDRELTRSSDFRRFGGADLRSTATYPANIYALPGSGNLPGLNSRLAAVPEGSTGIGLTPQDFSATAGLLNRSDTRFGTFVPESSRISAFASGSAQLAPSLRVYTELLLSRNEQSQPGGPATLTGGSTARFVVPAQNPFNPFGVPVGVDYRFSELGPRTFEGEADYTRWVLGAQGSLSDRFRWQLDFLADRNQLTFINRNDVGTFLPSELARIQQALSSTDPAVALNVFSSVGNNNPSTLRGLLSEAITENSGQGLSVEAIVRGAVARLPAGEVQVALGASTRREKGLFQGGTTPRLDARTRSEAVFAEAVIPLASPTWSVPGVHSLDVAIAARSDRYDTFGSVLSPQVGLRWRPIGTLLVRGSYGEAFKVPTLQQLYGEQQTGVSTVPDPLRGNEASTFIVVSGGNPELEPEEAQALTFGVVWEPTSLADFSLGATAFRVQQERFIAGVGLTEIISNPQLFPGDIDRAPPSAEDQARGWLGPLRSVNATTTNFGGVDVRGIDLELRYTLPASRLGRFTWSAFGSYVDSYEIRLTPSAPTRDEVGRANFSGYPVRLKGSSQLTWAGPARLGASVTSRYLHSYTDYDGINKLAAQTLWDAQLTYATANKPAPLSWGLRVTLGVVNLTNEQGSFSTRFTGYDHQQADLRGRFIYAKAQVTF